MIKPPPNEPWKYVLPYFPKSFGIDQDGVFRVTQNEKEYISGPCWVTAFTRSDQGDNWGQVIDWIDQDGRRRSAAFPISRIIDQGSSLLGELGSLGLKVFPGKLRYLIDFLGSFTLPVDYRLLSVNRLGWMDTDEYPVFVMSDKTIGIDHSRIVFQPLHFNPSIKPMQQAGSLEQWKTFVGSRCVGNPSLIFSLCCAFSGPLMKSSDLDCFGFHLYGASSKGKTTGLQVAASVFGCGTDPAASKDSCIRKWNTTPNALEITAAIHNDSLLCLDEMGTCDANDFGKVIYDLMGGTSKERLQKDITHRYTHSWRTVVLSTGEISAQQKIEESTKRSAKTGQLVRLIDIPIPETGVILESHGKSPETFVDQLKKACSTYYGTAGETFIHFLTTRELDAQSLKHQIQHLIDVAEHRLVNGRGLQSYQNRVLRKFALLIVAGELAIDAGVLQLSKDEIFYAILSVFESWLADEHNIPMAQRGVIAVREFILKHREARFRDARDKNPGRITNLAGYCNQAKEGGLYLLTEDGMREACEEFNQKEVLAELERQGFLFTHDRGFKSKHTIDGQRMVFYAIKKRILGEKDSKVCSF